MIFCVNCRSYADDPTMTCCGFLKESLVRKQRTISVSARKKGHLSTVANQAFVLLICSAVVLALAPLLMPESYSWIAHTTSESASQGTEGAWMARSGFLLFGLAVVIITSSRVRVWDLVAIISHRLFGVLMIATAVFSSRSWIVGAAYDRVEDFLHSLTASAMGFAFAFGVFARLVSRERANRSYRALDWIALIASVLVPLLMLWFSHIAGLLQRTMFIVAYVWYSAEALSTGGKHREDRRVPSGL